MQRIISYDWKGDLNAIEGTRRAESIPHTIGAGSLNTHSGSAPNLWNPPLDKDGSVHRYPVTTYSGSGEKLATYSEAEFRAKYGPVKNKK